MKDDYRRYLTRKDRLEAIAEKASGLTVLQAGVAWDRLLELMNEMAHPEARPCPRFNDLLLNILRASVRGRAVAQTTDVLIRKP